MEPTGLISYFEMVLTAEQVKSYKPCKEVYQWAAEKMKEVPENILVVSAHSWDIAGAGNAGMRTAYLKQNKEMLYPLGPAPDFICSSLHDLANQLALKKETVN
jgi:2-haloacid dehalogenase